MQTFSSLQILCVALASCVLLASCAPDPEATDGARAYRQARALAQRGQLDQAEAALDAAIDADPDGADLHLLRGAVIERRGRLDDAEAAYREALRIDPNHPNPPLHLERIGRMKALEVRIGVAQNGLNSAVDRGEAHLELADLFAQRLLAEPAQHHYALALRHDPNDARAHAGMAVVLVGVQRQVVGLYHASEALRLSPREPRALGEMIWVLATSSDETLRDPDEAIRLALGSTVDTPRILDGLAAAYAQAGRHDDAVATAEAAIEAATRAGEHTTAKAIESRLRVYAAGRSFVGPPIDPS